jgi:hypothetical protein
MPATNLLLHHTMLATDAWTWAEIFHIVAQRFLVYKYAHRIKNVNFINFGKTENRAHILCQLRILRNLKALIHDAAAWRQGLGGGGGENGVGRRQGELARHLIGELARQDADGKRCVLAGYESPSASWGARTTKARRWVLAVMYCCVYVFSSCGCAILHLIYKLVKLPAHYLRASRDCLVVKLITYDNLESVPKLSSPFFPSLPIGVMATHQGWSQTAIGFDTNCQRSSVNQLPVSPMSPPADTYSRELELE